MNIRLRIEKDELMVILQDAHGEVASDSIRLVDLMQAIDAAMNVSQTRRETE